MNYLYHRIPENMQGEIFYPLNELKDKYPESYNREIEKYKDRKSVLKTKIPILDCLWNDVLHLTCVNPKEIMRNLKKAGFYYPPKSFYKVNPSTLEEDKTIIYLYKYGKADKEYLTEKDFKRYNPDLLDKYTIFPKATKKYYQEMSIEDKNPLLFVWIPHILYRGNINIGKLEVLKV